MSTDAEARRRESPLRAPPRDTIAQAANKAHLRIAAIRFSEGGVMVESDRTGSGDSSSKKLGAGAIASLAGIGALLIFIVQNTEDVRFDFLFLNFTWPLWLYTIVVALIGALVWFGLGVMRRHRRRQERRDNR